MQSLHFSLFLLVLSDLWIRCPASISVDLKPGESSADISSLWRTPQTSHDAKYLTSSHKKTDRFPAGSSYVTWSVSNDNINFKTCTVEVSVNGKWITDHLFKPGFISRASILGDETWINVYLPPPPPPPTHTHTLTISSPPTHTHTLCYILLSV